MAGQLLLEGSAAEAPGGPTLQPRLSRSTDKGIPALGAGPERSPQGPGANPACEEQGLVQLEACSPDTLHGSQQAAPCSGPRLGAGDTMWVRPRNLRLHGARFEDQQSGELGELERGWGAAAGQGAAMGQGAAWAVGGRLVCSYLPGGCSPAGAHSGARRPRR